MRVFCRNAKTILSWISCCYLALKCSDFFSYKNKKTEIVLYLSASQIKHRIPVCKKKKKKYYALGKQHCEGEKTRQRWCENQRKRERENGLVEFFQGNHLSVSISAVAAGRLARHNVKELCICEVKWTLHRGRRLCSWRSSCLSLSRQEAIGTPLEICPCEKTARRSAGRSGSCRMTRRVLPFCSINKGKTLSLIVWVNLRRLLPPV